MNEKTLPSPGWLEDPDASAVLLDDPLADGEADAGAGIVLLAVQAAKRLEDPARVRRVHADAVVAHLEAPHVAVALGLDADLRVVAAGELHGVADEVLEHPGEVRAIGEHGRQRAYPHACPRGLDRAGQRLERLRQRELRRQRLDGELAAAGARVLEQVADQQPRLLRRAADPVDEVVTAVGLRRVAALEQLGVHRDRRQRRLQVVRRHRRELLELGVGAQQLGVGALELGLAALQRVGHRVEPAREVADLVLAVLRHARRQVAGRELTGRLRRRAGPGRTTARRRYHVPATTTDQHEPEPADPDRDRERRLRLGVVLALRDEPALAVGEPPQVAWPRPATSSVRSSTRELAAARTRASSRASSISALDLEDVVEDRLLDVADARALAGIVGQLALELADLLGVAVEALLQRRGLVVFACART